MVVTLGTVWSLDQKDLFRRSHVKHDKSWVIIEIMKSNSETEGFGSIIDSVAD